MTTETIIYQADLWSQQIDEFEVVAKLRPDGKAEIWLSHGASLPALVEPGKTTIVSLRMPWTPQNVPIRLCVTRKDS